MCKTSLHKKCPSKYLYSQRVPALGRDKLVSYLEGIFIRGLHPGYSGTGRKHQTARDQSCLQMFSLPWYSSGCPPGRKIHTPNKSESQYHHSFLLLPSFYRSSFSLSEHLYAISPLFACRIYSQFK